MVAFSLSLATWIVISALLNGFARLPSMRASRNLMAAMFAQPRSIFGMHLAHIGIAVFVVGVTMVNGYQTEKDVRMEAGDEISIGAYHFRFNGIEQGAGANYTALIGNIDLLKGDTFIRKMRPEKRIYASSAMPMTEAAIDSSLTRDLYVSLGEPIDKSHPDGAWVVRLYHKPFVGWIWGGCVMMALGCLLALSDRRYRTKGKATGQLEAR